MKEITKLIKLLSDPKIFSKTILFGGIMFLLFGFGTALIPNEFFLRMTPTNTLDYIFLFLTPLLFGMFLALSDYPAKKEGKCPVYAFGGTLGGFLGFGCSICNQLLVLSLGVVGVLTLFEPVRPLFGVLGIVLLSTAIIEKVKQIRT